MCKCYWLENTVDFEQPGFELQGSTYTQNFFNKYSQVLHLWVQPTVDQRQYFHFTVGNMDVEGWLSVLFHAVLYKGLEHLSFGICEGSWNQSSSHAERRLWFWGVETYMDFRLC